jgi:hypothetical protein
MLQENGNPEEQRKIISDDLVHQNIHSECRTQNADMSPSTENQKKRKHNQISDSNNNEELQIMEFADDNQKSMPEPSRHKKPKKDRSNLIVSKGT